MAPEPDDDVASWRRAYRSTLTAAPGDCPGDEALAALALGELDGEARARVADHVVACARCADDVRLLGEMHREASRGRTRWPGLRVAAAAAAVVAVAAGLLLHGRVPATDDDRLRGGDRPQAVAPLPDARLADAPAELAWRAAEGARAYRLRLFDARAEPVWESGLSAETSRPLPAEIRARLRPGASYFWIVDVQGPEPATRLGPFWFHLGGGG